MRISIIGIGRLGGALALAFSKKGYAVENLVARDRRTARWIEPLISPPPAILSPEDAGKISSEVVFITTQDGEISGAAGDLAEKLNHRPVVYHTSGSLSSEILKPLRDKGCPTGSIHPLVSVSDPALGAGRFPGAFFCIEAASEKATAIAEKLVADLGGRPFSIETGSKALYHASAVAACGHLVALIDISVEMLSDCGLTEADARRILLPLIESTVENLNRQTPAQALTGTFARADVDTFERHLAAIEKLGSPEILAIYLQLGERSLHLAEEQNADREKLEKLRKKISLAKKNLRC
ncbi:MAG: Rossmann-like and DUF2520 domain-containing protein [Pyrinomonadaceae bacterium]